MPFRNETDLDSDRLQIMTAAFDQVVAQLGITPDDPRRGRLASLIMQLAKAGVLESERLADQARAGLK